MGFMASIKKESVSVHVSQIPAVIEIVSGNVRKCYDLVINRKHEGMGHSHRPCAVHLMTSIVQRLVVHIEAFTVTPCCYLVRDSPTDYGTVMYTLLNQF